MSGIDLPWARLTGERLRGRGFPAMTQGGQLILDLANEVEQLRRAVENAEYVAVRDGGAWNGLKGKLDRKSVFPVPFSVLDYEGIDFVFLAHMPKGAGLAAGARTAALNLLRLDPGHITVIFGVHGPKSSSKLRLADFKATRVYWTSFPDGSPRYLDLPIEAAEAVRLWDRDAAAGSIDPTRWEAAAERHQEQLPLETDDTPRSRGDWDAYAVAEYLGISGTRQQQYSAVRGLERRGLIRSVADGKRRRRFYSNEIRAFRDGPDYPSEISRIRQQIAKRKQPKETTK